MANNYKIKVQVEIEACADPTADRPIKKGIGTFEQVILAEQAHSIEECEQIVLQTHYEAVRDALAHHLSAVSRQYALGVARAYQCSNKCPARPGLGLGVRRLPCVHQEHNGSLADG
jgi:hypothetical protein